MPSLAASGKPMRAPDFLRSAAPQPAAARFAQVLGGLEPEGRLVTRGAKASQVYRDASPAVVLVISEDSLGSGALVSADGRIVTNLHVVGDSDQVGVIFKPKVEGAKVSKADLVVARVIRRDEVADLALLQVAEVPAGLKPLSVGGAGDIEVGSNVHAIGHPTGEAWTYTQGIVSQIRKDYGWAAEDKVPHTATVIQTQTPINPGNSGGPLIDDDLEIVGVNSFSGEGEGMNFAVSGDDVKAFLTRAADRRLSAADKAKAEADDCQDTVLSERRSEDPKGTNYASDGDCDGVSDGVAFAPDDKKQPMKLMVDANKDGKIDTVFYDDDRDGDFDLALFDTDYDGKPDVSGEYRRGEPKPFRYERIKQ